MKLSQYIEQLTSLMESHHAEDFDVKTRRVSLSGYGEYSGELVEDVTGDNFCLDLEAGIAFVDCDASDLENRDKLIERWKNGKEYEQCI